MAPQADGLLDKFEDMERVVGRDLRRAQRRLKLCWKRNARIARGPWWHCVAHGHICHGLCDMAAM